MNGKSEVFERQQVPRATFEETALKLPSMSMEVSLMRPVTTDGYDEKAYLASWTERRRLCFCHDPRKSLFYIFINL